MTLYILVSTNKTTMAKARTKTGTSNVDGWSGPCHHHAVSHSARCLLCQFTQIKKILLWNSNICGFRGTSMLLSKKKKRLFHNKNLSHVNRAWKDSSTTCTSASDCNTSPNPLSGCNQVAAPCWHHWHMFTQCLALYSPSHLSPKRSNVDNDGN